MVSSKCEQKLMDDNYSHTDKKYGVAIRIYSYSMAAAYGIALLVCFICNLTISHTLSWFFIVLGSVALAFSITNLPVITKKYKWISAFFAAIMVYVLLFICCQYVKGDWLISIAYPIASVSVIFIGMLLLIIKYFKVNWGIKSALISLIAGVLTVVIPLLCDYLIEGKAGHFHAFFRFDVWPAEIISNKIIFILCIGYFIVGAFFGIAIDLRQRRAK